MRTSINKKSDFDFIVLDNEGNAVDMPSNDFTLDLWTWGSKCRFRASSIGGVLKGCKSDNGKLRVYVDNPGFVPGKLVGEWVSYVSSEEYPDGTQRTCRYISDFGIDMVDGDSQTNEVQVLAMMQYIQGASAYEIACEYGFDGTEQEWLDSLALPANEAAAECRTLMTELSSAEAQRVTNEDVRTTNEETRVQQESARVTAEQQRVQAESDRAWAETNRGLNEQFRGIDEQRRNDNEAARVEAEKNRVANESSRVSDEALRVQAENERVEAESGRVAAESSRENAEAIRERTHKRLMDAYKEFSKSEAQRETAEADRRAAEQVRVANENARQTAEQDRANAEANRVEAEGARKTAEDARIANESTRQANEQARVEAETSRESAETNRADAEAARVEAEQARAEEFAGFTATLAAKEDAANKVTSINADADDVHYPSAKAVKDSLAKVKNIEVTPDMLSESTKQFINASGGGTITNFADDEDLTTVDNALKFADKAYDPITFSGMGRKYLRKNMVDGKNILTQAMLPSANTIYIIQYDYDLNGATITIPENCILDFQGGSLGNGTIAFSHTYIESSEQAIFNTIAASGTLKNTNVYCSWFGNFENEADAALIINRALSFCGGLSSKNKEVFLPNRAIDVYTTINIIAAVCINGNHKKGRNGSTTIYACTPGMEVFKTSVRFCDSALKNIDIKNKNGDTIRNYIGIEMQAGESFIVENVKVYNANIAFDLSTEYEISLCRLENISAINCLIGLKVNEINNGWINGLYVRPNWFSNNNIGIDINGGVNTTIEGGNCEIGRDESTHDWMTDNLGINIYGKAKVNIIGCVWGENYHPIFGKVSQQAKLYVTGDTHIISPIITEDDATISVVNDLFLTSPYSQLTNKKPIIDLDYKFIAYDGYYWSHFINKIDGSVYKFINLRTKRQNWLDYDVPYTYGIVSDQFVEGELSSNWTFILDLVIPNSKADFVLTLYRESVANNMQFVIPAFNKNINARLLYTYTSDDVYNNRLSLPYGDEDINEPQRVRLGIILAENKLKFVYDNFVSTQDINIDGFLNFNAKNFLISGGCYVLGIQVYNEALSSKEVRHLLSHYKPGNKDNLTGPTSNRPATAPIGYKYYDTTIGADVVMKNKVYTEIVTPKWGLDNNAAASRPTLSTGGYKGYQFYDTTLNKPIWWTGNAWVDATGAEV